MDYRLELIQVPVSDIDRAIAFYTEQAGFRKDHDARVSDTVRFVQLTPPGSACSISLTEGVHDMKPGSLQGLQMVVQDAQRAYEELRARGVQASEIEDFPWGRFVNFTDPDGNAWAVQQIPARP